MDVHKALEDTGLIDPSVDPVDEYNEATTQFLNAFHRYTVGMYGERCSTFDADCPTCKLWKLYDATQELVVI